MKASRCWIVLTVVGITVDCATARNLHQSGGIRYDAATGLPIFDYNVSRPSLDCDAHALVPEELTVIAWNTTDPKARKRAKDLYAQTFSYILNRKEGLVTDEYRHAVTFSFCFDPENNYKIVRSAISHNQAKISGKHTFESATDLMVRGTAGTDLTLWHDFIAAQDDLWQTDRPEPVGANGVLGFDEIVFATTRLVRQATKRFVFNDAAGVECIARAGRFHFAASAELMAPHLFLAHESSSTQARGSLPKDKKDYYISATSSWRMDDAVNLVALAHFDDTGQAMLSTAQASALAFTMEQVSLEKRGVAPC